MKAKAMKKTLSCILALTLTASMMAESLTAFAANDGAGTAQTANVPEAPEEDEFSNEVHPTNAPFVVKDNEVITSVLISKAHATEENFSDSTAWDLSDYNVNITFTRYADKTNTASGSEAGLTWTGSLSLFAAETGATATAGKYTLGTDNDNKEITSLTAADFDQLGTEFINTQFAKVPVVLALANNEVSGSAVVASIATTNPVGEYVTVTRAEVSHLEIVPKSGAVYYAGENIARALYGAKYNVVLNSGNILATGDVSKLSDTVVGGVEQYTFTEDIEVYAAPDKSSSILPATLNASVPLYAFYKGKATNKQARDAKIIPFCYDTTIVDGGSPDKVGTDDDQYAAAGVAYKNLTGGDLFGVDVTVNEVTGIRYCILSQYGESAQTKEFGMGHAFELGGAILEAQFKNGVSTFIATHTADNGAVTWKKFDRVNEASAYAASGNETGTALTVVTKKAYDAMSAADKATTDADAAKIIVDFNNTKATTTGTAAVRYMGKEFTGFSALTVTADTVKSISKTVNAQSDPTKPREGTYVKSGAKLTYQLNDAFAFGVGDVTMTVAYDGGGSVELDLATDLASEDGLFELVNKKAELKDTPLNVKLKDTVALKDGVTIAPLVFTKDTDYEIVDAAVTVALELPDTAKHLYYKGEKIDRSQIKVTATFASASTPTISTTLDKLTTDYEGFTVVEDTSSAAVVNSDGTPKAGGAVITVKYSKNGLTAADQTILSSNGTISGGKLAGGVFCIVGDYIDTTVADAFTVEEQPDETTYYIGQTGMTMPAADVAPTADASGDYKAMRGAEIRVKTASGATKTYSVLNAAGTGVNTSLFTAGDSIAIARPTAGFVEGVNSYTLTYTDDLFTADQVLQGKTAANVLGKATVNLTGVKLAIKSVELDLYGTEIDAEESATGMTIEARTDLPVTEFETGNSTKYISDIAGTTGHEGSLVVTYNNGKKEVIKLTTTNITNHDISIGSFDRSTSGKKDVTLTYYGNITDSDTRKATKFEGTIVLDVIEDSIESLATTAGNVVPQFHKGDTTLTYKQLKAAVGAGQLSVTPTYKIAGVGTPIDLTVEDNFNKFDIDMTTFDTKTAKEIEVTFKLKDDPTVTVAIPMKIVATTTTQTWDQMTQTKYTKSDIKTFVPSESEGGVTVTVTGQAGSKTKYTYKEIFEGAAGFTVEGKVASSGTTALVGKKISALTDEELATLTNGDTIAYYIYYDKDGLTFDNTSYLGYATMTVASDRVTKLDLVAPTKTEYFTSATAQLIDFDGGSLTWTTGSGDTGTISLAALAKGQVTTGFGSDGAGHQAATVQVIWKNDAKANQTVDVTASLSSSLEGKVKFLDTKDNKVDGGKYADAAAKEVPVGAATVKITVEGITVSYDLTVTKSAIKEIKLGDGTTKAKDTKGTESGDAAVKPAIKNILMGNSITAADIQSDADTPADGKGDIIVYKNDGSIEIVHITANELGATFTDGVKIVGLDNTTAGAQTVQITYGGKFVDIPVKVVADSVESFIITADGTPAVDDDTPEFDFYLGDTFKFAARHKAAAELTYKSGAKSVIDLSKEENFNLFTFTGADLGSEGACKTVTAQFKNDTEVPKQKFDISVGYAYAALTVTASGDTVAAKPTTIYNQATWNEAGTTVTKPLTLSLGDTYVSVDFYGDEGKIGPKVRDQIKMSLAEVLVAANKTNGVWQAYIDDKVTKYSQDVLNALAPGEHKIYVIYSSENDFDSDLTFSGADVTGISTLTDAQAFTFTVSEDAVKEIAIATAPAANLITYVEGATGAKKATVETNLRADENFAIEITTESGKKIIKKVKANSISVALENAYDANTAGTYYAEVTYQGKTAKQPITITALTVDSITVNGTGLNKKIYGVGATKPDYSGLSVEITYAKAEGKTDWTGIDGTLVNGKTITNGKITLTWAEALAAVDNVAEKNPIKVTGFDSSAAGKVTLTVAYGGKTAELKDTVTIAESTLTALYFVKFPNTTTYKPGETPDLTGAEITASFTVAGTGAQTPYTVQKIDVTKLTGLTFDTTSAGDTYVTNTASASNAAIKVAKYNGKDLATPIYIYGADNRAATGTEADPNYIPALPTGSSKAFVISSKTVQSIKVDGTQKTTYYKAYNDSGLITTGDIAADENFDTTKGNLTVNYADGSEFATVPFSDLSTAAGGNFTIGGNAVATQWATTIGTVGKYTVDVAYWEADQAHSTKTTSYDITVAEDAVEAIAVTAPEKTDVVQGANLDLNGAKLTVTMKSGRKAFGTGANASDTIDLTTAVAKGNVTVSKIAAGTGKQTITVTYKNGSNTKTATFDINVVENAVKTVEIISQPSNKNKYTTMDSKLDLAGATIRLTYDGVIDPKLAIDYKDIEITATNQDEILAENNLTLGAVDWTNTNKNGQKVKITYNGSTTIYDELIIYITAAIPTKIELDETSDYVKIYKKGTEKIDTTKGAVKVTYDNDTTGTKVKNIPFATEGLVFTADLSATGKTVPVTMTYTEGENTPVVGTFNVEVTDRIVKAITLTPPTKLSYKVGDKDVSFAGASVKVEYEGNEAAVTYDLTKDDDLKNLKISITDKAGTTVSAIDTSAAGEFTVKVALVEDETKFDTFKIVVASVSVTSFKVTPETIPNLKVGDTFDLNAIGAKYTVKITYSEGDPFEGTVAQALLAGKVIITPTTVDTSKEGTTKITVASAEDPMNFKQEFTVTVKDSSMPSESEIGEEIKDATDPTDVETALPVGYDITTNPVVLFTESGSGDDVTYTFVQGYKDLDEMFAKGAALTLKTATDKYVILVSGEQAPGAKTKIALPKNAKAVKFIGADENAKLNLGKLTAINVKDADIEFDLPVTASKNVAITVGKGHKLIIGEQAKGSVFGAIKGDKATSVVEFNSDVTVASIANFATVNTAPEHRTTIAAKGSIKVVSKLEGCYRLAADATASGISVEKCEFDIEQGAKQGKITIDKVSAPEDGIGLVVKFVDNSGKMIEDESTLATIFKNAILYTKAKNDDASCKFIGIANNEDLAAFAYGTAIYAEDPSALTVTVNGKEDYYPSFAYCVSRLEGEAEVLVNKNVVLDAKAKFPTKGLTSLKLIGADGVTITTEATAIKVACPLTIENLTFVSDKALTISTTGASLTLEDVKFNVKAGGMTLAGSKKDTTLTIIESVSGVDKVQNFKEVKVMGYFAASKNFTAEALTLVAADSSLGTEDSIIVFGKDATVKIGTLSGEGTIGILAPSKKFKAMNISKVTAAEGAIKVAEFKEEFVGGTIYVIMSSGFNFKADEKTPIFKIKDKTVAANIFDASGLTENDDLMFSNDGKGNISLVPMVKD